MKTAILRFLKWHICGVSLRSLEDETQDSSQVSRIVVPVFELDRLDLSGS